MVAASTDGQNLVVEQHRPDKVPGAAAGHWFERHTEARQDTSAERQGHFQLVTSAVAGLITAWWPVLQTRVARARRRRAASPAAPRSNARDPSISSSAPSWAEWPFIAPLACHSGPAPPPAARCRAPDTAGHRGCKTAARSCGKPGSASRRSAGCTDRSRRAWASKYRCGPCRTPSRAGWRSPRAGGSSGRSRGVTALGLVARLRRPPRGRARPSRSRIAGPPYSPAGRTRPVRCECGRRLKAATAVAPAPVALPIAQW
jgi:hypothetical protein